MNPFAYKELLNLLASEKDAGNTCFLGFFRVERKRDQYFYNGKAGQYIVYFRRRKMYGNQCKKNKYL